MRKPFADDLVEQISTSRMPPPSAGSGSTALPHDERLEDDWADDAFDQWRDSHLYRRYQTRLQDLHAAMSNIARRPADHPLPDRVRAMIRGEAIAPDDRATGAVLVDLGDGPLALES